MLSSIHIRNLGAIKDAKINFEDSPCVFSGESGVGKSTIFDAICLLFGGKNSRYSSHNPIYITGELKITTKNETKLAQALRSIGIDCSEYDLSQEDSIIIERIINSENRSKCLLNRSPVTLGQLKQLSSQIIEICSQKSHHEIILESNHILMLDSSFLTQSDSKNLTISWHTLESAKKKYQQIVYETDKTQEQFQYYSSLISELEALNYSASEEENLMEERKNLMNMYKSQENISLAHQILTDGERSIIHNLNTVFKKLRGTLDDGQINILNNITIELNDFAANLQNLSSQDNYLSTIEEIEVRIGTIRNVARKYGIETSMLIPFLNEAKAKMHLLTQDSESLQLAEKEMILAQEEYLALAKSISQARSTAAKTLADKVNGNMQSLSLQNMTFHIIHDVLPVEKATSKGIDAIYFSVEIQNQNGANIRCSLKNISGGELSRIILALKASISHANVAPIIIFDEVDIGVSGATASKIGQKLHAISDAMTIVITHQPQVACYGKQHVLLYKSGFESKVKNIYSDERVNEIARMLSGEKITIESKAAAEKMLQDAHNTMNTLDTLP